VGLIVSIGRVGSGRVGSHFFSFWWVGSDYGVR